MGKTSLVREFRERLPAGTAFRLGRCLSYGRSVTYSALADVLRQELGLRQEDSATRAEAEQALLDVLNDEPSGECLLFVTSIELAGREAAASFK